MTQFTGERQGVSHQSDDAERADVESKLITGDFYAV
jgi:hypothetical protein